MSLKDLPIDIYIYMYSLMDPLDILTLSQTCSVLRGAARERLVWQDAIAHSTARNHIFARAFRMPTMSKAQLQDTSTAASRVLAKLRTGCAIGSDVDRIPSSAALHPHHTHLIRASDLQCDPRVSYESWNSKAWQHFEHVWVIPGGRFVVAYTHREMVFYDLRELTPLKYRGEPLRVRCDDSRATVPSPSADGREIRVATVGDEWEGDNLTIIRFVFGDTGDTPRVIRHTTLLDPKIEERREIQLFVLTNDFFICYYTPQDAINYDVLCVWDYKQDMFAVWDVARNGYKKLYFDNDHAVLMTTTSLMGWHIPPLRRRHQQLRLQEVPAPFIIPLKCNINIEADSLQRCESLSDWYNSGPPSFFDLTSTAPPSYSWFTFKMQDSFDSYLAAKQFVYHSKSHFKMGHHTGLTLSPYTLCNDYVVKVFVGRPGRIFVATSPCPGVDAVAGEGDTLVELALPREYELNPSAYESGLFSFDPASGKLAYLWGWDQTSIVVLDYLKHPEE